LKKKDSGFITRSQNTGSGGNGGGGDGGSYSSSSSKPEDIVNNKMRFQVKEKKSMLKIMVKHHQ